MLFQTEWTNTKKDGEILMTEETENGINRGHSQGNEIGSKKVINKITSSQNARIVAVTTKGNLKLAQRLDVLVISVIVPITLVECAFLKK